MEDNKCLLKCMVDDMESQPPQYRPGPYWMSYSERIRDAVLHHGLKDFRACPGISKGYGDVLLTNPLDLVPAGSIAGKILRVVVESGIVKRVYSGQWQAIVNGHIAQMIKYRDLHHETAYGQWFEGFRALYDTPDMRHASPSDVVTLRGEQMGRAYLSGLIAFDTFRRHADFDSIDSFLELGGGFGATFHAILSMLPNIRKAVYIDLPPLLYIGTQYLKHFFGTDVIDYLATRSRARLTFSSGDAREVLALCPWQFEALDCGVDIVWNSHSFQEMPEESVQGYARHMLRCLKSGGKFCLSFYETPVVGKTLKIDRVLELISNQGSVRFHRIEPSVNLDRNVFYLGTKED